MDNVFNHKNEFVMCSTRKKFETTIDIDLEVVNLAENLAHEVFYQN